MEEVTEHKINYRRNQQDKQQHEKGFQYLQEKRNQQRADYERQQQNKPGLARLFGHGFSNSSGNGRGVAIAGPFHFLVYLNRET